MAVTGVFKGKWCVARPVMVCCRGSVRRRCVLAISTKATILGTHIVLLFVPRFIVRSFLFSYLYFCQIAAVTGEGKRERVMAAV